MECCKKDFLMVESLLFLGAGAGVGASEKNPEQVKNGPSPQHWPCLI